MLKYVRNWLRMSENDYVCQRMIKYVREWLSMSEID